MNKVKSCFYLLFILIVAGGTLGAGNQALKRSTIKVAVLGGSVATGTLAKLDVLHDCFQDGTTKVNRVRETQTWWSILERILSDWVEGGVEVINAGVTGNSTTKGSTRLQTDMLISTSPASEDRWETISSGRIIHAPNVFKAGGRIMICGRYCSQSDERFRELQKDWRRFTSGNSFEAEMVDPARVEEYHHGLRTGVFLIDGTRPRLVMELLSAGDSSYTGVVRYGDEFVISDYSMHEYYRPILHPGDWNTPSDIYVWRIRFGE